jgi:plasmid maintenance system killer protein
MRGQLTDTALKSHLAAPLTIQKAFGKQTALLLQNLRHPSLRAKKIDETNDVWQARINKSWRFLFKIEGDTYIIINIFPHPK